MIGIGTPSSQSRIGMTILPRLAPIALPEKRHTFAIVPTCAFFEGSW